MIGHLIGRIRTQVAWQVGMGVAVLLVVLGVATSVVVQNNSNTSAVGVAPSRGGT